MKKDVVIIFFTVIIFLDVIVLYFSVEGKRIKEKNIDLIA